jgi:hypothetical protein
VAGPRHNGHRQAGGGSGDGKNAVAFPPHDSNRQIEGRDALTGAAALLASRESRRDNGAQRRADAGAAEVGEDVAHHLVADHARIGDEERKQRAGFNLIVKLRKAGDEVGIDGRAKSRRCDQRQRPDARGARQRQLAGDGAAELMPDEIGALDADHVVVGFEELREERDIRSADVGAGGSVAGKVEGEDPADCGKRRQREHPRGVVGAEAMDENEGLFAGAGGDVMD